MGMLDVWVKTFCIPVVISKIYSFILSLLPPIFSTGNPFQIILPLSLSSILKKPILFFIIFKVFSNSTSYITPSIFSIGWGAGVFSVASWGVFGCDSLVTSPNFWVNSFTSSNLFVIGLRDSATFMSWVCSKILFLILGTRCSFCCSANLRRLSEPYSVTLE